MGLTRIQSNTSSFIQPGLGGHVNAIVDPGIDWFKVGMQVHIPEGGIYEIVNISGFVFELKLMTAVAAEGQAVDVDIIHPINDHSAATSWGGDGKEW